MQTVIVRNLQQSYFIFKVIPKTAELEKSSVDEDKNIELGAP